jgi:hypothetical protein
MAKKQHFLIVDVETTQAGHVADFGAVLTDRKGNILKTCAVLTSEYYLTEPLFFDDNSKAEIWSKKGQTRRERNYKKMLETGTRSIASCNAINIWLNRVQAQFNPELTAYNLAFDLDKCMKSNINLNIFENRFCLWHLASFKYGKTKKFLDFILAHHLFNPPTDKHNMTYKTDAETMTKFITGNFTPEPHTGLEDIIGYELPLLIKIVNTKNWREKIKKYSWANFQVKDHYTATTKHINLTNDLLKTD